MQKGFDIKPASNEKYFKVKRKSYGGKINTSFHNNGVPEESLCLSLLCLFVSDLHIIYK